MIEEELDEINKAKWHLGGNDAIFSMCLLMGMKHLANSITALALSVSKAVDKS